MKLPGSEVESNLGWTGFTEGSHPPPSRFLSRVPRPAGFSQDTLTSRLWGMVRTAPQFVAIEDAHRFFEHIQAQLSERQ